MVQKENLKFSPYRKNEPLLLPKKGSGKQKGGSAMPDYTYTNRHGWIGWASHWYPQKGGSNEWLNALKHRKWRIK